jgi:lipoprotein-anchoring transpeptidase ErfK/SrfK
VSATRRRAFLLAVFLPALAGCADRAEERAAEEPRVAARTADSLAAVARAESIAALPKVGYRAQKIEEGQATLNALRKELGDDGFLLFLRVNRADLGHVRAGETLAVPVPPLAKDSVWSAYSPFPTDLSAAASFPKLILVSLRVQALGAYESGRLVHWAPTSSGRKTSPTPVGLYHTNWKSRRRNSTVDEAWILEWAINIENRSGISIHKYDLPGYPASHSCVRLLEEDAMWLYDWAEQWALSPDGRSVVQNGTPVVVFGAYDWDGTPPWRRLVEDPSATAVPESEIEVALREYLPGTGNAMAVAEQARGDSMPASPDTP